MLHKAFNILKTALLQSICLTICSSAWSSDGYDDAQMRMPILTSKSQSCIDKVGCSNPCCDGCKEVVRCLSRCCNCGATAGFMEESNPRCSLICGIACFPVTFLWRFLTCCWQPSLDCCERNRALCKLCSMKEGDEVKEKRFTMKFYKRTYVSDSEQP